MHKAFALPEFYGARIGREHGKFDRGRIGVVLRGSGEVHAVHFRVGHGAQGQRVGVLLRADKVRALERGALLGGRCRLLRGGRSES